MISHNDLDHINAIPEIIDTCEVRALYANNAFIDTSEQKKTERIIKSCLTAEGISPQHFEKLDLRSKATLRILWPDEQTARDESISDNDKSIVSLLEFGAAAVLLCSDIEKFAQNELIRRYPDLHPDVVVVPHHGSANTLDPEFLEKLGADILIYSCSRRGRDAAGPNQTRSFYTPTHGAVTIRIDKNGVVECHTFKRTNDAR